MDRAVELHALEEPVTLDRYDLGFAELSSWLRVEGNHTRTDFHQRVRCQNEFRVGDDLGAEGAFGVEVSSVVGHALEGATLDPGTRSTRRKVQSVGVGRVPATRLEQHLAVENGEFLRAYASVVETGARVVGNPLERDSLATGAEDEPATVSIHMDVSVADLEVRGLVRIAKFHPERTFAHAVPFVAEVDIGHIAFHSARDLRVFEHAPAD